MRCLWLSVLSVLVFILLFFLCARHVDFTRFLVPHKFLSTMVLCYSPAELVQLNTSSPLPEGIYKLCRGLGIARRRRYVHRGSRRKFCTASRPRIFADDQIPVVWSPVHFSRARLDAGVNSCNIVSLEYSPIHPPTRLMSNLSQIVDRPVKFGLINVRSVSNKSFILNDFCTTHDLDFFINDRNLA